MARLLDSLAKLDERRPAGGRLRLSPGSFIRPTSLSLGHRRLGHDIRGRLHRNDLERPVAHGLRRRDGHWV
jgi:hypothetical protein